MQNISGREKEFYSRKRKTLSWSQKCFWLALPIPIHRWCDKGGSQRQTGFFYSAVVYIRSHNIRFVSWWTSRNIKDL